MYQYLCIRDVDFASFYDFSVEFWECSNRVVFFGNVPTVWYFLGMFKPCGIFWECSNRVVFFGNVPTVWYFLGMFQPCGIFFVFHFIITYTIHSYLELCQLMHRTFRQVSLKQDCLKFNTHPIKIDVYIFDLLLVFTIATVFHHYKHYFTMVEVA